MRVILAVLIAVTMAGCTAFDYGFDDPTGEMSVVGDPYIGCEGGRAFIFGTARNTGDVFLEQVSAIATVYAGGGVIGVFSAPVVYEIETFQGEEGPIDIIIDSIPVEETGTFQISTSAGCGTITSVEYSFDFRAPVFEEQ